MGPFELLDHLSNQFLKDRSSCIWLLLDFAYSGPKVCELFLAIDCTEDHNDYTYELSISFWVFDSQRLLP